MGRIAASGNILQAAIFCAGAWWLGQRWSVPMGIAAACAGLQLSAAVAILRGRPDLARWASLLTLVGIAVVIGLYWNAAQHLQEAYGGDARKFGQRSQWTALAAVPWFGFFPLCQAVAGGKLLQLFLPAAVLLLSAHMPGASPDPVATWPEQPKLEAAAQAAFSLWQGGPEALPEGSGAAAVLLTPWIDGKAGRTVRGSGPSLKAALETALAELPTPSGQRQALVVDLARRSWARGLPGPYDIDAVIDADIRREGRIDDHPAWVIASEGTTVVATWHHLAPPVILEAPAPAFKPNQDVFSHLFFTDEASIRIGDREVEGQPYTREIWRKSIGGDRSSCVVALSETFIDVLS